MFIFIYADAYISWERIKTIPSYFKCNKAEQACKHLFEIF
jgi:hypothetical protein